MMSILALIFAFSTLSLQATLQPSQLASSQPINSAMVATLPAQAPQTVPLPPVAIQEPILMDVPAVPQQSSDALKTLSVDKNETKVKLTPVQESQYKPLRAVVLNKEDEIKRLNSLSAFNLQTNKAPLSDVMTLLADACQMSYVGLEKGVGDSIQISVNISKNPYETLQYLCDRYNVALGYDRGVWHFGLFNDNELIARVYHMRYNNLEEVTNGSSGGGGSSGGSSSSSSSSSGGSSASSNVGSSASSNFTVKKDGITTDIKNFLTLTAQDPSILTAADYDVDAMTEVLVRGVQRVLPKVDGSNDAKSQVIYNSDNRSLYILATRAQHQWIEKYIAMVDKPQKQILVETKIYETALNPQTGLGINWTGAFGASDHNSVTGNTAFGNAGGVNGSPNFTAILNTRELKGTLTMLDSDSNTTSVQYPRQVTVSNRPVAIASVQQTPIQQTSTSTETGGTGTTQNQSTVSYITTGTNISILPRIMDDNKILMDISVTVSTITGSTTIGGNPYPIVSERDYKTQSIVETGYTLAIGGLKEVLNSDTYSGFPIVSKLPMVGALFKNRSKSHTDKSLLIFISPTILKEYRGGVQAEPQFVIPHDKDYPQRRIFQGNADESYTDIMLALTGMQRDIDEYSQLVREEREPKELFNKLDGCENELKLIRVRLQEIALQQPDKDISQASHQIEQYLKDLNELRRSITKHRNLLDR